MVSRACCRADVNSDFSANVDESIPYVLSSDLSSESFIDEMSGKSGMVQRLYGGVGDFLFSASSCYDTKIFEQSMSRDDCKNDTSLSAKTRTNSYLDTRPSASSKSFKNNGDQPWRPNAAVAL